MDREKVIKAVEEAFDLVHSDYIGTYDFDETEWEKNKADALALLKEQEAVEPKQVGLYGKEDWYGLVCVCPDCKAEWMSDEADTHFCPKCGQEVKWE